MPDKAISVLESELRNLEAEWEEVQKKYRAKAFGTLDFPDLTLVLAGLIGSLLLFGVALGRHLFVDKNFVLLTLSTFSLVFGLVVFLTDFRLIRDYKTLEQAHHEKCRVIYRQLNDLYGEAYRFSFDLKTLERKKSG